MNGCIYRTEENRCEFWSDNGAGIVSYCDYEGCVDKHPSNADKIRAMEDEELADFLDRFEMGSIDYSKTFCSWCKGQYNCRDDCLMDWLRKEAQNE